MNNLKDVINGISSSKLIGITYHTSPDGDALGSALALSKALNKMDKENYIISKEKISRDFSYLNADNIITGEEVTIKENTDCLIALDCGNTERLSGDFQFNSRNFKIINVDHHLSNDRYGDINYVNTDAAATAEIIYDIIKEFEIEIDEDIAKCIYTSLITDTGSFRHSGTSSKTHSIAGELIDIGIDFSAIHREVFDNKPLEKLKLYGKVFDTIEMFCNRKVCFMTITESILDELAIEDSDTSDVISFGTQIDTVEVVALFKENKEGTKISIRSKNNVDVRKIAEAFGGGGHTKASGCFIKNTSLEDAKQSILLQIKEQL